MDPLVAALAGASPAPVVWAALCLRLMRGWLRRIERKLDAALSGQGRRGA